ncbi:hypothetical protein [Thalassospira australica]|uniref:hypothetical protein n=1 Tax=Thalassospira australica TaxID=1528106 RepID=UPI00051A49C6|nr:hypothetical protein [Thalassospira australica]
MTDLFVFVVETAGFLLPAGAGGQRARMVMFSPRCTIGSDAQDVNLRKGVDVNDNFFTKILMPFAVLIRQKSAWEQGFCPAIF